jgi:hypothetical protein
MTPITTDVSMPVEKSHASHCLVTKPLAFENAERDAWG